MGEGDGCDGWVLKEPINARSGEFKTPKSALPRPVRDRSLFCADGERRLRRGGRGRVAAGVPGPERLRQGWPCVVGRRRARSRLPGARGRPPQAPLPFQPLPWPSSCSRATCTPCCSWMRPSPMHLPRAGSAKRRKPRGRPPRPCGPPTDPTAPAGPPAERRVRRGRRVEGGRGKG